jgi:hypothetical protein
MINLSRYIWSQRTKALHSIAYRAHNEYSD